MVVVGGNGLMGEGGVTGHGYDAGWVYVYGGETW